MYKPNQILASLIMLAGLLFPGCDKDHSNPEIPPQVLEYAEFLPDVAFQPVCDVINISAGSNNVLAQALTDICENGIIFLEAGLHTETEPLIVAKTVKIVGEIGAILKLPGEPKPLEFTATAPNGNILVQAGLHFKNAPGSLIQDIEFQPIETDGNTAIILENSTGSGVMHCQINGFQFGVLVEKSDRAVMMFNTIVTTSRWQSGELTDAHAITIINGKDALIADNEVSNSVFGIWGCDEGGIIERNDSHDNYIAYILCNVPKDYLTFPDGSLIGAHQPATGYKVRENIATNSSGEGYLVIDGAHDNLLQNNAAINSGTYDVELTTLTLRFGIPAPEAYNNTVMVGDHPNLLIKDCGTNNTIVGGILVDTSVDPCN